MLVWLHVCMYVHICESSALWRPEGVLEFLGTIVTDVVNCHEGVGNHTHTLCKSSHFSKPLSHVFNLSGCFNVLF